uniref:Putative lipocalin-3 1 n=1 Tax=Amblyomma americanum TaxID=6943 RepID=A0A0C9RY33_AMBAM
MTKAVATLLFTLALSCGGSLTEGTKVVVLQDKAIPRDDLISFISTKDIIWAYKGSNELDNNITCKADYNIMKVNNTTYKFNRNFTVNENDRESYNMEGHLLVTKSNKNAPEGICSAWVVTDEFGNRTLEVLIFQTTNHTCAVFYILPLPRATGEDGDALLTEDDFYCEMRMKSSITSTAAPKPAKGQNFQVKNNQPPDDCRQAYSDHCTQRSKGGDKQVYRPSCKTSP